MKVQLKTLNDLKEEILKATDKELDYLMARYGGPHNVCLRSKIYDYQACDKLTHLAGRALAARALDAMLTEHLLADTE